jgi:hypothetical protein
MSELGLEHVHLQRLDKIILSPSLDGCDDVGLIG